MQPKRGNGPVHLHTPTEARQTAGKGSPGVSTGIVKTGASVDHDKLQSERDETKEKPDRELTGDIGINEERTLELQIHERFPKYSAGRQKFLREPFETNLAGQTQFADPAAEYQCRSPICGKVINRRNLTVAIKLHLGVMRYGHNRDISISVNGRRNQPTLYQNIRKRGWGRGGALPPS